MRKLFVTGDIHGKPNVNVGSKSFSEGKKLSNEDIVWFLGDFGVIWKGLEAKDDKYWLEWLLCKPFTCMVTLGNHENYDVIETLPECYFLDGKCWYYENDDRKIYFAQTGEIYKVNEKLILNINGATSIDKFYRIPHISWWKQEDITNNQINYTLDNLKKFENIDYVFSHTCPNNLINLLDIGKVKFKCPTSDFLEYIDNNYSINKWYFGHFHKDIKLTLNNKEYNCLYRKIERIL